MENECRIAKFEILIDDIRNGIHYHSIYNNQPLDNDITDKFYDTIIYKALYLIYYDEFQNMNQYAKAIYMYFMNKDHIFDVGNCGDRIRKNSNSCEYKDVFGSWPPEIESTTQKTEPIPIQDKIQEIKKLVSSCNATYKIYKIDKWNDNRDSNIDANICILFWALTVLAVDDTDKEKRLSLICDFARMLKVTDDEMKDIVNVIKCVFQDETFEPLKTEKVSDIFEDVIDMYKK